METVLKKKQKKQILIVLLDTTWAKWENTGGGILKYEWTNPLKGKNLES